MKNPQNRWLHCWFWPTDLARRAPKYWTPRLLSYDEAECRAKQQPPRPNRRGARTGVKRLSTYHRPTVDEARRARFGGDLLF